MEFRVGDIVCSRLYGFRVRVTSPGAETFAGIRLASPPRYGYVSNGWRTENFILEDRLEAMIRDVEKV